MAKVGCKLPNGLVIAHKGKSVTLKGANDAGAVLGSGITHGVDDAWIKDWINDPQSGATHPAVKTGAIYVIATNDVRGPTREHAEVATGLEPMDPDKPMPGIEPTDETKAVLKGEVEE